MWKTTLILKNWCTYTVIQCGLQGFIVENIKDESTEANNLSHIPNAVKMFSMFLHNLTV